LASQLKKYKLFYIVICHFVVVIGGIYRWIKETGLMHDVLLQSSSIGTLIRVMICVSNLEAWSIEAYMHKSSVQGDTYSLPLSQPC
jgi:hypothetical protein